MLGCVRSILRHEAARKRVDLVFQGQIDECVTSINVEATLPAWNPPRIDYTGLQRLDEAPVEEYRTLGEIQGTLYAASLHINPKWQMYIKHCDTERAHGLADVCYALRHIPENGIKRGDVFYTSPTNASLLYEADAARPATTSEHEAFCAEEKAPNARDRSTRCPSSLRPTLARLSFALRCSRGNGDRNGGEREGMARDLRVDVRHRH